MIVHEFRFRWQHGLVDNKIHGTLTDHKTNNTIQLPVPNYGNNWFVLLTCELIVPLFLAPIASMWKISSRGRFRAGWWTLSIPSVWARRLRHFLTLIQIMGLFSSMSGIIISVLARHAPSQLTIGIFLVGAWTLERTMRLNHGTVFGTNELESIIQHIL